MAQFYYYLYLIKFNDGRYYIGSRKSKCKPEDDTQYMGSPKTFKHLWTDSNFTKTKYIIKEVDSMEELRRIEPKLIKEAWKKDGKDKCLNRHAAPHFHTDICSKAGKKTYELGKGIHAQTPEQKRELGKKVYELGKGIHAQTPEQKRELGKKVYELGKGIHGITPEERSEFNKKAGKISAEKHAREFTIVSPTGEVIHGRNLKRFADENNVGASHLRKVINGKNKSSKGYTRYNE
jgi:hypothetical protein